MAVHRNAKDPPKKTIYRFFQRAKGHCYTADMVKRGAIVGNMAEVMVVSPQLFLCAMHGKHTKEACSLMLYRSVMQTAATKNACRAWPHAETGS